MSKQESGTFPLPPAFLAELSHQLGDDLPAYLAAMEAPYFRGIRLSARKPVENAALLELDGIEDPVPWSGGSGYYLSNGSTAGLSPLHEAGACYIQEPSAMAPAALLNAKPGEKVLDLCAAPGGKSTQIADFMDGKGLLVCNEPVPSRARTLSRNIERMGISNALVTNEEPEKLANLWQDAFDAVLVDAPCSGEGMFRRHPETRTEWTESTPGGCAERQRRILESAIRMVRPGGRLVYSTCTFNHLENEEVIYSLTAAHPDWHTVPFTLDGNDGCSLESPDGMLHLFPHRIRGEGHFAALLVKDGEAINDSLYAPAELRLARPDPAVLKAYEAFRSSVQGGDSLPSANAQFGDTLLCCPSLPPVKGIRVLRAGCQLGTLKGKVFQPDHALAMSLPLPYDLPCVELSKDEALRYQRGEVLPVSSELNGWTLALFKGLALGFGKVSAGEMKNHYPKGLRRP